MVSFFAKDYDITCTKQVSYYSYHKMVNTKPDLGSSDWLAIAIHDPISRPKSVQTTKKSVKFQGLIVDGKSLRLE